VFVSLYSLYRTSHIFSACPSVGGNVIDKLWVDICGLRSETIELIVWELAGTDLDDVYL